MKRFKCELCEKFFGQPNTLELHIDTIHKRITYQCDICEKEFSQAIKLKDHFKLDHMGEKLQRFECELCNETFSQNSGLKGHISTIHLGEKWKCLSCEKTFPIRSYWKWKHTCRPGFRSI